MVVSIDGVDYVANWWTMGTSPSANNGITGTGQPWTITGPGTTGSKTSKGFGGMAIPVPTAPENLSTASITSTAIVLNWQSSTVLGGLVSHYDIFQNGVTIGTVVGNITSFSVVGLTAATAYQFTVEAIDDTGHSLQSAPLSVTTIAAVVSNATVPAWNVSSVYTAGQTVLENGVVFQANWWTTGADPSKSNGVTGTGQPWTIVSISAADSGGSTGTIITPVVAAPGVPLNLAVTATSATSIVLAWASPAVSGTSASSYVVFENGVQFGTVAGTTTTYTASGLTGATAYKFTVEALDSAGASAPSAALMVTTLAAPVAPAAPVALVVPVVPNTVAAWAAASVYTTGQTVSENGFVYQANWWTQGNDPSLNSGASTTWTVIGKVNATPTSPDAPLNVVGAAVSGSEIDLYWNASTVQGSGTVTGYEILANGREIGTAAGTSFDATSLVASTSYKFTVQAIDATGISPASAGVVVMTLAPGAVASTADFAPYVDMSLYGRPTLVSIAEASGVKDLTLAFVQSSGPGTIGWAGVGTITDDTQSNGTSVQSEIKALQAIGGNVIISFGGSAGTDPAVAAASAGQDAAALQAEYQSVITRYGVTSLDFDIEGGAEANQASLDLRSQALVGLEKANPGLQISFTLPVLPTGLDNNGINIVNTAVQNGLHINVINLMAMDYGSSVDNGGAMGTDAIYAIQATEKQLLTAHLDAKIGITPMIGVNDVSSETFSLADAQHLASYVATDPDVARVAIWSIGRDNGSAAGNHYAVATGSGETQVNYAYSSILQHA